MYVDPEKDDLKSISQKFASKKGCLNIYRRMSGKIQMHTHHNEDKSADRSILLPVEAGEIEEAIRSIG